MRARPVFNLSDPKFWSKQTAYHCVIFTLLLRNGSKQTGNRNNANSRSTLVLIAAIAIGFRSTYLTKWFIHFIFCPCLPLFRSIIVAVAGMAVNSVLIAVHCICVHFDVGFHLLRYAVYMHVYIFSFCCLYFRRDGPQRYHRAGSWPPKQGQRERYLAWSSVASATCLGCSGDPLILSPLRYA